MLPPVLTSRRVIGPLLVVGLLISSLLPARYDFYGAPIQHFVIRLLAPLARPLSDFSGRLHQSHEPVADGSFETLSEELKIRDGAILRLQAQIRQLREENAQLIGLKRRFGDRYLPRPAQVLFRSSDPAAGTLVINQGARDALRVGVIAVEGPHLVGRITQVQHSTATLEPLTLRGSLVEVVFAPARLPPTGLPDDRRRVVQLKVTGPDTLATHDVDRAVPVEVGDYARLWDTGGSTGWPQEAQFMIVGRVTRVEPDPDNQLRQRVEVRTQLNWRHIDSVTVIVPIVDAPTDSPPPREKESPK